MPRRDAAPGALHALLHGSISCSSSKLEIASSTPEMAVRGLQQAIALGGGHITPGITAGGGSHDDDVQLQLPLLNLLALYDSTKQHGSASRAAAFLVAATRPCHLPPAAPAPVAAPKDSMAAARASALRPHAHPASGKGVDIDSHLAPARVHPNVQRPVGWWLAVPRASVRSGEAVPLWVLWEDHARPGVLGARYLQARAHLLCSRWEEASRDLQALLPLLPQLRCALRSFGVSDVALLQQTVSGGRKAMGHGHAAQPQPVPLMPLMPLMRALSRGILRSHPQLCPSY